ncbi:MAG: hypothetical protein DHS20C16_09180 [Phycisphaerae bacterium]|nr:MAG: hypothetical protein DHS20C16_09180 [Phycisphaerae bacterium]
MLPKKKPKTRSPLRQDPLPQAGDSTYAQARDILNEQVFTWVMATTSMAGMTWVHYVAWSSKEPIHPGHFGLIAVVVGIIGAIRIRSHLKRVRNYVLGEMARG